MCTITRKEASLKQHYAIHILSTMGNFCQVQMVRVCIMIPVVHSKVSFFNLVNGGVQHDGHHSCYCSKYCPYMRHRHLHWHSPTVRERSILTLQYLIIMCIRGYIEPTDMRYRYSQTPVVKVHLSKSSTV